MRFRLLAFLALFAAIISCTPTEAPGPSDPLAETYAASLGVDFATMTKYDTNLYYKDITVGTGTALVYGKSAVANYAGFLVDGRTFTTNVGGNADTIPIVYSSSGAITGWILGVPGMKPGGVRRLIMGSSYAYGPQGRSGGTVDIPKNATLIFDIYLKAVK